MITTARQQMIDKVQKLLAQAEATTFQAEADTFRDKAAQLMAEHNITMTETTDDQFIEQMTSDTIPLHDQHLRNAVARFNGVFMVRIKDYTCGGEYRLKTVGTRSDLEAYEYMIHTTHRQRNSAFIKFVSDRNGNVGNKDRDAFYLGFAYGVNNQVTDLLAAQDSKIQQWGLVPVDNRKKAEQWYTKDNNVRKGKRSTAKYEHAGVEAGRSANLNRGLTATSGKRLAIGM